MLDPAGNYSAMLGQLQKITHSMIARLNIDEETFDWIDLYLQDKALRDEIYTLENAIQETRALPMDREELKKAFKDSFDKYQNYWLNRLSEHLVKCQNHEIEADRAYPNGMLIYTSPVFLDGSESRIDAVFNKLEKGVTTEEKTKRIERYQKNIQELYAKIEKDFSPKTRWIYSPLGRAIPWPKGCQWYWYVKTWTETAMMFNGPVDVYGFVPTDAALKVYEKLKMGNLTKKGLCLTNTEREIGTPVPRFFDLKYPKSPASPTGLRVLG